MRPQAPGIERRAGAGRVARLDRLLYPGHGDHWDDTLFRERILSVLEPSQRVLDLGAGAGIVPQMDLRGRAAHVIGVDPDPRVADNPHLDEARVGTGDALPLPDACVDLVVSDNVLEHLDDPVQVFREVHRVLRPGGRFLAKTPNRWHYMPLIATLTPHRLHRWVNALRGRAGEDTFPTRYRVNTPGAVRRVAAASGFLVRRIELVEGRPEYLRLSTPTYLLGWIYERMVNGLPFLRRFRILLIVDLEKPA